MYLDLIPLIDSKEVKRVLKLLNHLAIEPIVLLLEMRPLVVVHTFLDQEHLVIGGLIIFRLRLHHWGV